MVRRRAVPLAAAAVIAGILLVGPSIGRERSDAPGERVRGPDAATRAEALLEIRVITPAADAIVESQALEFAWEAVEDGAVYRLTVTDESGEPLWSQETSGITLRLPAEVDLVPGRLYFWFVDVLLADGRTGSTGVVSFRLSS
jgi:hypothetical protein